MHTIVMSVSWTVPVASERLETASVYRRVRAFTASRMLEPGYGYEDHVCGNPDCRSSLVDGAGCQQCGWRPDPEGLESVGVPIDELNGIRRRIDWLLDHSGAERLPPEMIEVLKEVQSLTRSDAWPKLDDPRPPRRREKRGPGSSPSWPQRPAPETPRPPRRLEWVKCRHCKVEVKKADLKKHEQSSCSELNRLRSEMKMPEGSDRQRRKKAKPTITRPDLIPSRDRAICPLCNVAMKESNLAKHLRSRCPERDIPS